LLLYTSLAVYFVHKMKQAFKDPEISSYSLVGQLEDKLNFNETIICLDDGATTFSDNIDVNSVFYVSNTDLSFNRLYRNGTTTGICGMFNGDSRIDTNNPIFIGVDHSKFLASSVTYNIYYQYIAFDDENIKVPTITSRKTYTQNKAALQSFLLNFEKATYKIDKSPVSLSTDKYECPIFSTIEANDVTSSLSVIQLRYTARKTVYTITFPTIPLVFSAVSGILDTCKLVFGIALAKFFELKYYENIANHFKPLDQKLRASFLGFFAYLGFSCVKGKDKEVVDEIKKEKEFIEKKMDVMNYLGSHIKEKDIELYKAGSLE